MDIMDIQNQTIKNLNAENRELMLQIEKLKELNKKYYMLIKYIDGQNVQLRDFIAENLKN